MVPVACAYRSVTVTRRSLGICITIPVIPVHHDAVIAQSEGETLSATNGYETLLLLL